MIQQELPPSEGSPMFDRIAEYTSTRSTIVKRYRIQGSLPKMDERKYSIMAGLFPKENGKEGYIVLLFNGLGDPSAQKQIMEAPMNMPMRLLTITDDHTRRVETAKHSAANGWPEILALFTINSRTQKPSLTLFCNDGISPRTALRELSGNAAIQYASFQ